MSKSVHFHSMFLFRSTVFYMSALLCMQMESTMASFLMDRFTVSLKAVVDHMYDTVIKPPLLHKYHTLVISYLAMLCSTKFVFMLLVKKHFFL